MKLENGIVSGTDGGINGQSQQIVVPSSVRNRSLDNTPRHSRPPSPLPNRQNLPVFEPQNNSRNNTNRNTTVIPEENV